MKSYVVLVAVIIVLAALGYFVYYNYEIMQPKKTTTGTHIYIGAIYNGSTQVTNFISSEIHFGSGPNLMKTVYYVVLSIWDNNKSYDQIGITSDHGHFYSTYSYTKIVNGSIKYIFDPKWFSINPGTYAFSMLASNGSVLFTFDNVSFSAYTGGDTFSLASNEIIGNHSYSGLTIYEEIYGYNDSLPGISYNFSQVNYASFGNAESSVSHWTHFSHNVSANLSSVVYVRNEVVNIYNLPSLTLTVSVENIQTSSYLLVSDFNITLPKSGQYLVNLLAGNYTAYFGYQGQIRSYNFSMASNSTLKINPIL